ncbi:DUF4421 family protein [Spirochaeta cellobiosiphila]|uniref:DUF4421 family protein n=1 Tax=Spirochaeta cellobiosiphila TaxID=504483 RepID=UPI00040315A0|nr:DUF4421 family protein [Spirochaeta cellobiosiphila]
MINKRICLALILFSFLTLTLFSEDEKTPFILQYNLATIIQQLNIASVDDPDNSQAFVPNAPLIPGISLLYGRFSGSISYALVSVQDNDVYGASEYSSFGLSYYRDNWGLAGRFVRNKGFYLDSSEDSDYEKYPSMMLYDLNAEFIFKLSKKDLSLKGVMNEFDNLSESGGAWLGMMTYNYHNLDDIADVVGDNVSEASFQSFGLLPGYTYSYVKSYFFVRGLLFVGPAVQYQNYIYTDRYSDRITYVFMLKANLNIGVDRPKNYWGFNWDLDYTNLARLNDHIELSTSTSGVKLYYGHRY